jgi:hypothetical protein
MAVQSPAAGSRDVATSFRRLYARAASLNFITACSFKRANIAVNTTATITNTAVAEVGRPKPDISIALHSRHTVAADDGSYVQTRLLAEVLPTRRPRSHRAEFYLSRIAPRRWNSFRPGCWLRAVRQSLVVPVIAVLIWMRTRGHHALTNTAPRWLGSWRIDHGIGRPYRFCGWKRGRLTAGVRPHFVLEKIRYDRTVEAVTSSEC